MIPASPATDPPHRKRPAFNTVLLSLSRPRVRPHKAPALVSRGRRKFRSGKAAGRAPFRPEPGVGLEGLAGLRPAGLRRADAGFRARNAGGHCARPAPPVKEELGQRPSTLYMLFYYKTTEHTWKIHHPVTTSKAQIFEKKRRNRFIKLYD